MSTYESGYAPFPRNASASGKPDTVDFKITGSQITTRKSLGGKCAYCAPGSSCKSCKRFQAQSQYGSKTLVRSQIAESKRFYNTMLEDATEFPEFRY